MTNLTHGRDSCSWPLHVSIQNEAKRSSYDYLTCVVNSFTLYSFEWPSPHQKSLNKTQFMKELVQSWLVNSAIKADGRDDNLQQTEEWPDGKQHFIYPNLQATAKIALFAVKDGKMPGVNYFCHVCTGNTGLHPGLSFQKHYPIHPPTKKKVFISKRHSSQ